MTATPLSLDDAPADLRERAAEKNSLLQDALKDRGLEESELPRPVSRALPLVLACSDFAAHALIQHPHILFELARSGVLEQGEAPRELAARVARAMEGADSEAALKKALRQVRRREMIAIAWRDLTGQARLSETLAHLSALADACIGQANRLLYKWLAEKYGKPADEQGRLQELVVVALGKLGGEELNFSSDVDLVLCYPDLGETRDGPKSLDNQEFFTRLARKLVSVLSENTADGLAFRTDLRLRPFGESGPMVVHFSALEDYLANQGRQWERYAWIKARPVTGSKEDGGRLAEILRPFVFRRYLDWGTLESLREMKSMIEREVKKKGMEGDIKLGPGGIREIEFIVQVLQLLRGGLDLRLRTPSTRDALTHIMVGQFLPAFACRELMDSYDFLRRAENHVQEFSDTQIHHLPTEPVQQSALAFSMGYGSWDAFMARLGEVRNTVHGHFQDLLEDRESSDEPEVDLCCVWTGDCDDAQAECTLDQAGFSDASKALGIMEGLRQTRALKNLNDRGQQLLDRLVPRLMEAAGKQADPETVLTRMADMLAAIGGRTSYFSLMLENPHVLSHLARLLGESAYIAAMIPRFPVVLDELVDPRTLYKAPSRQHLEQDLARRLGGEDPEDLEAIMDELRVFKQTNVLRVAASDVSGAVPIMRVSDHLTDIAEVALASTLDTAWQNATAKHGAPPCTLDGLPCEPGFAVIGYGKLGGIELSYGSDLDMVFIHAGEPGGFTQGKKSVANTTFFARLAQKVLHLLSSHTAAGMLYETDMRLRPSGGKGVLVSHVDGFMDYQTTQARTWEHMALVRARPVAGDTMVAKTFAQARKKILGMERNQKQLAADVVKMRALMKQELLHEPEGLFDLKQGTGGIVDVEFIAQYLVLAHAHQYPRLADWTDNVRILETIARLGLIQPRAARFLHDAYLELRTRAHRLILQNEPALAHRQEITKAAESVRQVWEMVFGSTDSAGE